MKTPLILFLVLVLCSNSTSQCLPNISIKASLEEANLEKLISLKNDLEQVSVCKDSLALVYHAIGLEYYFQNDFDQAIIFTQSAKKVRLENNIQWDEVTGKSYHNLGVYFKKNGNFDDAEENFKKAIEIYNEIQSKRVIRSIQEYAGILRFKGEYNKAIQILDLGVEQANNFKLIEDKAACYLELALIYGDLENHAEAVNFLDECIKIYDLFPNDQNFQTNKAGVLINQSDNYLQQNKNELALEAASLALDLSSRFKDNNRKAKSLNNLGVSYKRLNKHQQAFESFQKALAIKISLSDNYGAAEIYNNLGDLYSLDGNWKEAQEQYYAAVRSVIPTAPEFTQLNTLSKNELQNASDKTKLLIYLSDLAKGFKSYFVQSKNPLHLDYAMDTYKLADLLIDLMRQEHSVQASKLFWREKTRPIYEAALDLCYLRQDTELAFYFLEKSKAVLLLDALWAADAKSVIPDSLARQQQSLQEDLNQAKIKLEKALWAKQDEVAEIRKTVVDAQEAVDAFQANLEKKYPQYYSARYENKVISLAEAKVKFLEPNTSMWSYFYGAAAVYVLSLNEEKTTLAKISRTKTLDQQIADYLDLYSTGPKRRNPKATGL